VAEAIHDLPSSIAGANRGDFGRSRQELLNMKSGEYFTNIIALMGG
jgi:hypothetical protein